MKKNQPFFTLCLLLFSAHCFAANTGANTSECENQMKRILSTTLDCTIKLQPDTLDEVVAFTNGAIEGLNCTIPLRAKKSDVYNHWITENSVALPTLPVYCKITGTQDNQFSATAKIRPACRRASKEWTCQINMSDIQGLGFLGKPLEAYVNTNQALLSEMNKHLNKMSESP